VLQITYSEVFYNTSSCFRQSNSDDNSKLEVAPNARWESSKAGPSESVSARHCLSCQRELRYQSVPH